MVISSRSFRKKIFKLGGFPFRGEVTNPGKDTRNHMDCASNEALLRPPMFRDQDIPWITEVVYFQGSKFDWSAGLNDVWSRSVLFEEHLILGSGS